LTCARADSDKEAIPAVTIAPFLRNVRRVTGENEGDFVFMLIGRDHARNPEILKRKSFTLPPPN
jgi:hypothetical protein